MPPPPPPDDRLDQGWEDEGPPGPMRPRPPGLPVGLETPGGGLEKSGMEPLLPFLATATEDGCAGAGLGDLKVTWRFSFSGDVSLFALA